MPPAKQIFIGLMSGTSLDGIDAVIVEFTSQYDFKLVASDFTPYPEQLRQEINAEAQNNLYLLANEDSKLHDSLASVYADACERIIKKSGLEKACITGIANHGQTVKHEPLAKPAYSLQLGNGQLIADLTNLDVFSQFRQADLAVGGQGAPLMPAFHAAWLQTELSNQTDVFVLNIGGIANITQLGEPTIGFDTGPGNVLMDQWVEENLGHRYDKNGDWARTGKANKELLNALLSDPYFQLRKPKSTGTDYFNLNFLYKQKLHLGSLKAADIQATLLQLTVESIAQQIEENASSGSLFVCGGGAQNQALMSQLKARLNEFRVNTTDALGVPSDWVEAVGFAWLGYCCNNKIMSNMPSVTGASKEVVLGELFNPTMS